MRAASHGHHFIGRSNRFWLVLRLAGFTPIEIHPEFDRRILQYGYGLTTAVSRPTARADQLAKSEFSNAATELEEKIRRFRPGRVAFLGKAAFAAMYNRWFIEWGLQPEPVAAVEAWVLSNPSGLNRGFRLNDLVSAYQAMRLAIEQ